MTERMSDQDFKVRYVWLDANVLTGVQSKEIAADWLRARANEERLQEALDAAMHERIALEAERDELKAFAVSHEQWEADLIMDNEAWDDYHPYPRIPQRLWKSASFEDMKEVADELSRLRHNEIAQREYIQELATELDTLKARVAEAEKFISGLVSYTPDPDEPEEFMRWAKSFAGHYLGKCPPAAQPQPEPQPPTAEVDRLRAERDALKASDRAERLAKFVDRYRGEDLSWFWEGDPDERYWIAPTGTSYICQSPQGDRILFLRSELESALNASKEAAT